MRFRRLLLALLVAPLIGCAQNAPTASAQDATPPPAATTTPPRKLEPAPSLSLELRALINILESIHFNRDKVRLSTYAELIPNTFKAFDGQKSYFLQSDLNEAQERDRPEALYFNLSKLGRLDPAFAIYARYEQRVRERIDWLQHRLTGDFDFTTVDAFELDRRELPWPADMAAADALWEKRLKFELLQELLNKKTLDEARAKVAKRYQRVLRNLDDFQADDVAEIFLTTIAGLYDPHSNYFSPDSYQEFSISLRLQLFGIGALLGIDDDICILKEIIPGGPADLSRQLKPNDKILAVAQENGEFVEIIGMNLRRIVQMIRGEKGTKVRLLIQPADAADSAVRKEIVIVRDLINMDSARAHGAVFQVPDAAGQTHPYGVITLPTFYGRDRADAKDQNSATADIANLINQLKSSNIEGLVLDLRRNGGGLLSEAVSLTGLFIPTGPVVQVKSHAGEVQIDEDRDSSVAYAGPLVVLTSRWSASASEIVAGALQNYGRAIVVGDSSTHGKGSVQTFVEMDRLIPARQRQGVTTGAAKVTIQKFYLPNGASTQLKGVISDIVIPSVDEFLPIGEQDQPHALPWDEISGSFFDAKPVPQSDLVTLRTRSAERIATLPEFALLKKTIARFKERQDEKTISLNLETRRIGKEKDKAFRDETKAERKALEAASAYAFTEFFVAPPPPPRIKAEKTTDDSDDEDAVDPEDEEAADTRYAKMDVYLRESLRILGDMQTLAPAATVTAAK